jgi:hypothetical protein
MYRRGVQQLSEGKDWLYELGRRATAALLERIRLA